MCCLKTKKIITKCQQKCHCKYCMVKKLLLFCLNAKRTSHKFFIFIVSKCHAGLESKSPLNFFLCDILYQNRVVECCHFSKKCIRIVWLSVVMFSKCIDGFRNSGCVFTSFAKDISYSTLFTIRNFGKVRIKMWNVIC